MEIVVIPEAALARARSHEQRIGTELQRLQHVAEGNLVRHTNQLRRMKRTEFNRAATRRRRENHLAAKVLDKRLQRIGVIADIGERCSHLRPAVSGCFFLPANLQSGILNLKWLARPLAALGRA